MYTMPPPPPPSPLTDFHVHSAAVNFVTAVTRFESHFHDFPIWLPYFPISKFFFKPANSLYLMVLAMWYTWAVKSIHARTQWIVKMSGQFADSFIELVSGRVSEWSARIDFSMCICCSCCCYCSCCCWHNFITKKNLRNEFRLCTDFQHDWSIFKFSMTSPVLLMSTMILLFPLSLSIVPMVLRLVTSPSLIIDAEHTIPHS